MILRKCKRWIWWKQRGKCQKLTPGIEPRIMSFWLPSSDQLRWMLVYHYNKNKQIEQNYRLLARINAPEFKPANKVVTRHCLLPWICHLKLWTFTYRHGVVAISLCISETVYKLYKENSRPWISWVWSADHNGLFHLGQFHLHEKTLKWTKKT